MFVIVSGCVFCLYISNICVFCVHACFYVYLLSIYILQFPLYPGNCPWIRFPALIYAVNTGTSVFSILAQILYDTNTRTSGELSVWLVFSSFINYSLHFNVYPVHHLISQSSGKLCVSSVFSSFINYSLLFNVYIHLNIENFINYELLTISSSNCFDRYAHFKENLL